jgi:succinate dehydrogenase/fumarate reductase flavoprotein subunit
MADYDVVVIGAGNAALAAAVSAREQGASRVAVLEKAPRELRGGNTHYGGGLLRFAYEQAEDLLPLVPDDNAAVEAGRFDPTVRDGLRTTGLALPKSNWAQRLDTPPFTAWPVTGGITFTFGGVKVNDRAQVQSTSWTPIPGLYACGEMVGGLFHSNYPGGTGLMSGAVFGRIAGANAAGG